MYDGISRDNSIEVAIADSSVVGISMLGFDARYRRRGFELRGQIYYSSINNTSEYNYFTSSINEPNNLGKAMYGYYAEISYDIFNLIDKFSSQLVPFLRYSSYDTQLSVAEGIARDEGFQKVIITTGLGWRINPGVVLKTDFQFIKSKLEENYNKTFNAGIALWF